MPHEGEGGDSQSGPDHQELQKGVRAMGKTWLEDRIAKPLGEAGCCASGRLPFCDLCLSELHLPPAPEGTVQVAMPRNRNGLMTDSCCSHLHATTVRRVVKRDYAPQSADSNELGPCCASAALAGGDSVLHTSEVLQPVVNAKPACLSAPAAGIYNLPASLLCPNIAPPDDAAGA